MFAAKDKKKGGFSSRNIKMQDIEMQSRPLQSMSYLSHYSGDSLNNNSPRSLNHHIIFCLRKTWRFLSFGSLIWSPINLINLGVSWESRSSYVNALSHLMERLSIEM